MATYGGGVPAGPRKQGMAIASLVIGILAIPTLGCLLIGAALGIVLGVVALTRANREPAVYGGKGMAIGGIIASAFSVVVAVPLAGIVAAIAIPSLLRARISANEAAAIGDVRSIISAQTAYQSASGGVYGSLECLATPSTCIRGYAGPTFLDPQLAGATTRNGYERTFHPGPPATGGTVTRPGLESFAVVLAPAQQGRTGLRLFCGDDTGRVCSAQAGPLAAGDGRCPPEPFCTALR